MSQLVLENCDSQMVGLVEQALTGEEVVIVRDSKPIAKIVSLPEERHVSHFGNAKNELIFMADDFDAPLEDFKDYS